MDLIGNNSMAMLEKSLDYTWQKLNVHNENIANITTPGYQSKYLTFEDELKKSIKGAKTAGQLRSAIENTRIKMHVSDEESLKADGNNVVADAEYVELARSQLQYEYLVQQVNDQFTRLGTVINGR